MKKISSFKNYPIILIVKHLALYYHFLAFFTSFSPINLRTSSRPLIFPIFPDSRFYQATTFVSTFFLFWHPFTFHPLRMIIIPSHVTSYLYGYTEIPIYRVCNSFIIASRDCWHNAVYSLRSSEKERQAANEIVH